MTVRGVFYGILDTHYFFPFLILFCFLFVFVFVFGFGFSRGYVLELRLNCQRQNETASVR